MFSAGGYAIISEVNTRFRVSLSSKFLLHAGSCHSYIGFRFKWEWSRYFNLRVVFIESQLQRVEGSNDIVRVLKMSLAFR